MLTKIILWRFTASMPTKLKWKSTAPGATKFSDCARHKSCSQVDTSALATSSFAGDLALDDAVRAVKDVLPPRAQGVSARQAPPFASPALNWKVGGACPLRLTIRVGGSQLLQSRPYFIFRQDKPSLVPTNEAASLLFHPSLVYRYRQIRN
jgi:hypothetical protein